MKLSTAHKIGRFFQYFVLILVGVIMIYPLVWMVGATFKSNAEIFAGIGFLTANPTLQGYIDAVTQNYGGDISIWRAFINTYSFVIPKVIFTVISSVIAAYGFSRFKFKGRDMLFGIMISTLFLHRRLRPGQDPVQDHRPDAEPLSGGLRSVPVHVELQRLHGSPALRSDPQQVPDVHLRQAVHGRRQRFQLEPYPGTVPDLHHPAVGRFLLRTGCLHRRHFRRRREGLNAALAVQNLL